MNRSLIKPAIVVAILTLSACGSNAAEPSGTNELATRLWIKPDLVDCIGEMQQKCMQIAETEDGEYLYFYDQIEGFTFVEGTSYVIDVQIDEVIDPPADGGSLAYSLVKVVEEN